ncbi:Fork-head domain-containing protein [Aphelenchoides fujianensis]|nr:Fork-head domain-containing protein [Aphelenchoides fujianensis]
MEGASLSYPTALYVPDAPVEYPLHYSAGGVAYWTPISGDPTALPDFHSTPPAPSKKRAFKGGRRGERRGTKKPPESYIECIRMAIEAHPLREATLAEIYTFLRDFHPFFRDPAYTGWKNSVRHNLSLMPCFEKLDKRNGRKRGKGHPWRFNPRKAGVQSSVDGAKGAATVNSERRRAKEQAALEMPAFEQPQDAVTSSSSASNSFGSEPERSLQVDQTPFIPLTSFYSPPFSHGYAQCGWPSVEANGHPSYPPLFMVDEAAGGVKMETTNGDQLVDMTHFPYAVDTSFPVATSAPSTFEYPLPVDPTAFYQQYAHYNAAFDFSQNTWGTPLAPMGEVDANFYSLDSNGPYLFAQCGLPSSS